jgi:hypothetical protein
MDSDTSIVGTVIVVVVGGIVVVVVSGTVVVGATVVVAGGAVDVVESATLSELEHAARISTSALAIPMSFTEVEDMLQGYLQGFSTRCTRKRK